MLFISKHNSKKIKTTTRIYVLHGVAQAINSF